MRQSQSSRRLLVIQSALAAALVLVCCTAGLVAWLGPSIFAEDEQSVVIPAALRLEVTGVDLVPLPPANSRWLMRSDRAGRRALDAVMHQRGWQPVDRLGSALIYRRGAQTSAVICRQYSRRYLLCTCAACLSQ